ncbi:MAG TPA: hypothetical protein DDZ20_19910 [Hyphomonas sp.]|nr:hypothetical protein [Hyphomonas sp.]HBX93502.1 hypothetical protein [Hyphomonas sp.]
MKDCAGGLARGSRLFPCAECRAGFAANPHTIVFLIYPGASDRAGAVRTGSREPNRRYAAFRPSGFDPSHNPKDGFARASSVPRLKGALLRGRC